MALAMIYLRLPQTYQGETDPGRVARLAFGTADWRRAQPADHQLDISVAWQALHYLITGDPWEGRAPEADIVCGGRLLTEDGTDELGFDVIYLAPDRVKTAADHLSATGFPGARYDLTTMASVGVQGAKEWASRPPEEARDRFLRPTYEAVTRFFADAAAQGQAIYKTMGPS